MSQFTQENVAAGLSAALEAGRQAGTERVQELKQQAANNNGQPVHEESGNAMVIVKLDGRSSLARALKSSEHTGVTFSRMGTARLRGYYESPRLL